MIKLIFSFEAGCSRKPPFYYYFFFHAFMRQGNVNYLFIYDFREEKTGDPSG